MNNFLRCCSCKNKKLASEFGFNRSRKNGLQIECKLCVRERNKLQRQKSREYNIQYAKKYREKNKLILKLKRDLKKELLAW